MSRRLAGKVALVVGVGPRVGRAVAEVFAADGAAVALVARSAAVVGDVAGALKEAGAPVLEVCADVSDDAEARRAIDATAKEFGGIDVLFNNVDGYFAPTEGLDALRPEYWDAALAGSLRTTALCCRHAIPIMRERGGGSIVNVTASFPTLQRGNPAFAAAKAGVIGLTRNLARLLHGDGIRVNAIAPGRIHEEPGSAHDEVLARPGVGIDVARAALFLASADAAWVTGQVLDVDGGDSVVTFQEAWKVARRLDG